MKKFKVTPNEERLDNYNKLIKDFDKSDIKPSCELENNLLNSQREPVIRKLHKSQNFDQLREEMSKNIIRQENKRLKNLLEHTILQETSNLNNKTNKFLTHDIKFSDETIGLIENHFEEKFKFKNWK